MRPSSDEFVVRHPGSRCSDPVQQRVQCFRQLFLITSSDGLFHGVIEGVEPAYGVVGQVPLTLIEDANDHRRSPCGCAGGAC